MKLLKILLSLLIICGIVISIVNFLPKTTKADGFTNFVFHRDTKDCYDNGGTCIMIKE